MAKGTTIEWRMFALLLSFCISSLPGCNVQKSDRRDSPDADTVDWSKFQGKTVKSISVTKPGVQYGEDVVFLFTDDTKVVLSSYKYPIKVD